MALDHTAGKCPQGGPFAPRRNVPATLLSTDVDPRQCRGAQQRVGRLDLCDLLCGMVVGKQLEAWWCGRAPRETRDKCDIEAGEVVLELKPGGGDLKDETAKPTTLDV